MDIALHDEFDMGGLDVLSVVINEFVVLKVEAVSVRCFQSEDVGFLDVVLFPIETPVRLAGGMVQLEVRLAFMD